MLKNRIHRAQRGLTNSPETERTELRYFIHAQRKSVLITPSTGLFPRQPTIPLLEYKSSEYLRVPDPYD
jgi:hypothetical protein